MKRTFALFLAILMLFAAAFVACDTIDDNNDNSTALTDDTVESDDSDTNGSNKEDTSKVNSDTEEDNPFEYNPYLELAWRKDDHTVVFQLDIFVSLPDANLLENVYIASTATGEPIASPTSYVAYSGELSKVWEVVFAETLPNANEFYLVFTDVNGNGDAALETVLVDYASNGVYGAFKKANGEYVAAVKVTDEEIEARKSLYIEWVKVVGQRTIAVKYSEPVTVYSEKINDFGHVGHIAPYYNGQLIAPATDEQLACFPGAQKDVVQRHTRYFRVYEEDPSIVLFIFSSAYYDDGSDKFAEDSADVDVVAWWNGVQTLNERSGGYTLVIREFPYECIESADTGRKCTSTRDIIVDGIDLDLLNLTDYVGADDAFE